MEVICLEEKAFYALIDKVIERLNEKDNQNDEKWISDEETMRLLNIKSRTTLQTLRDEGKIRFTQPRKKIILYDRDSINEYLEGHARETF
jgi:hypothetical protein